MRGFRRRPSVWYNSCRERILILLFPHRYYNYLSKMGEVQSRYYYVSWAHGIVLERARDAVDMSLRVKHERSSQD